MAEDALVTRENGIMTVVINRPEAKNAMNQAASIIISDAMEELDNSSDLQVAIITGAGGTFCSGMDLKGFLKGEAPVVEGKGFGGIAESPPKKPLIAAVEGYALAGGFELVLACDMVVAAENAKFGLPEPKRGLVAGAGGLLRLPRQIPYRIAMEMSLTGDFYTAGRAYELGLINRVTEEGGAMEGALALAKSIAANGPLAIAATKQILVESHDWPMDEMFQRQGPIMGPVFMSEDSREGATAFAEKRAPVWKGK